MRVRFHPLLTCLLIPFTMQGGLAAQAADEKGLKPEERLQGPGRAGGPGSGESRSPGMGGLERMEGKGEWRGPGKGPPGKGGGEFQNLSDEEKRRVREALERVWSRPEVKQAREQLMKANEEMRRVIRTALTEIDPETAPLLERMGGDDRGWDGGRGPGRPPDVGSPEFPKTMVHRLEGELLMFTPVEKRMQARGLHAVIMARPAVQEALLKLEQASVAERPRAAETLRNVYRAAVGVEFKKIRERENDQAE